MPCPALAAIALNASSSAVGVRAAPPKPRPIDRPTAVGIGRAPA